MDYFKKTLVILFIIAASLMIGALPSGGLVVGDLNMIDEGQFAAWANHMIHGKQMFRDIYIVYGPLYVYPVYLLFSLFEPSAFIVRLYLSFGGALGIIASYFILQHLRVSKYIQFFILGVMVLIPMYHLRGAAALWSIYLLFLAHSRKKGLLYILVGILAALTFLISQDFGIFTYLVILVHAIYLYLAGSLIIVTRRISQILVGSLLVGIAFVAWSSYEGWFAYYIQTMVDVSVSLSGINVPNGMGFPNYLTIFEKFIQGNFADSLFSYELWIYASLTVLIFAFIYLFGRLFIYRTVNFEYEMLLMVIFGFLLFTVLLTRPGVAHYFYTLPPSFIICGYFLHIIFDNRVKLGVLWKVLFFLIIAYILRIVYLNSPTIAHVFSYNTYLNFMPSSIEKVGYLDISELQTSNIEKLMEYLAENTKKGDYIFFFNDQPMFYMLTDRVNPTDFDLPFAATTVAKRYKMLNQIRLRKPTLIIIDKSVWAVDGIPNYQRLPEVYDYIIENYYLETSFDGVLIYRILHDKQEEQSM